MDAIAESHSARVDALHKAEIAIACMMILGAVLIVMRYIALAGVSRLTVGLMGRIASDAFWRIQRLSTDWQANNFAGSIVRL